MKIASKGQPEEINRVLNVQQTAERLGVSVTTVYRLIQTRTIPFLKYQKIIRFQNEDIEKFLTGCRIEAINNEYAGTKNKGGVVY